MISNYSTVAPLMKTGKIRDAGVTSAKPHPAFPLLPGIATVAPGFSVEIWVGVFAQWKRIATDHKIVAE
jgi:tripartite-type tricarboxylate transporter receptor subunit TctC